MTLGVGLSALSASASPRVSSPFATLPGAPDPVAFSTDEAENVYTANLNDTISRVTVSGVAAKYAQLDTGSLPCAITTVPDSNTLWVGNAGTHSVAKITYDVTTGVVTTYALPGSMEPCALVSNKAGDLFVADAVTGAVSKVSLTGTIFTANKGNHTVSKITAAGIAAVFSVLPDSAAPDGHRSDGF